MSRNKGLVTISNNFEPRIAQPLDSRLVVNKVSDLTSTSYWQSGDLNTYLYEGIAVAVWDDDPVNNGVYILKDSDYLSIDNWIKVGSDNYGQGFTSSNGEVSISLTQSSGLTFSNSDLVVNVDGSTIIINTSGELEAVGATGLKAKPVYQIFTGVTASFQEEIGNISDTPSEHSRIEVYVNGLKVVAQGNVGGLTSSVTGASVGIVGTEVTWLDTDYTIESTDVIEVVYEA